MISLNEAQRIALEEIAKQPYSELNLTLATGDRPLELPFGYRFPYESYVGTSRVSRTMLILFVDGDGNVEVEWDDFERDDGAEKVKLFKDKMEKGQPDLPPLQDVLDKVRREYADSQLEMVEAVWLETDHSLIHWQVGFSRGVDYWTILVSGTPKALVASELKPRSRFVAIKWKLGRAIFKRRRLRVDLTGSSQTSEHLRSYWTVWSCMSCLTEFLEDLGYGEVGPRNVRVEIRSSSANTAGASSDIDRGVPRVSFLFEGGWSTDVSVVLHELGHALWALLYTRSPMCIDLDQHTLERDAVEEAFADYLATTILANGRRSVEIGRDLEPDVAKRFKLPRRIESKPFDPSPGEDDPHQIGRRWVNLLWDFRLRVREQGFAFKDADQVVIAAHVKPRPGDQAPSEPMACYFESLKNTAGFHNLPFADWDDLKHKHTI